MSAKRLQRLATTLAVAITLGGLSGCPTNSPEASRGPFSSPTLAPSSTGDGTTPDDEATPPSGAPLQLLIEPAQVVLAPVQTRQLKITARYAGSATLYDLTAGSKGTAYSIDSASVATVSGDGLVTSLANGSAVLTVSNQGVVNTAAVSIQTPPPPPTSLALIPNSLAITAPGDQALTAMATLADGSNRNVTLYTEGTSYESSDETVALVSANGLVTPLRNGLAVITASNRGVTAQCPVTVGFTGDAAITGLSVKPKNQTLSVAGQTLPLQVTALMTDGGEQDKTAAATGTTYRASNSAIATVSAEGLVTARGNGLVTIHVTNGAILGEGVVSVLIEGAPAQSNRDGWIHGEVHDPSEAPIAGARAYIDGLTGVVTSDAAGKFTFPVVPGSYQLTIEKDGYSYAHRTVAVQSGEHVLVDPVYLIAGDSAVTTIGAAGGSHSSADGLAQLTVPAGATGDSLPIRVTSYTQGRQIPELPEASDFTYCVRLEPELATFDRSITVRIKNTLGFPPGTQIPVGLYAQNAGQWQHLTMAAVSADGQWVEFKTRHFSRCDVNTIIRTLQQDPRNSDQIENQTPNSGNNTSRTDEGTQPTSCRNFGGSSLVSAQTGRLQERHALPAYRSLGRMNSTELVYNSDAASMQKVLAFDYDLSLPFVPDYQQAELRIAGRRMESYFVGQKGKFRYAWQWDGRDATGQWADSGIYDYELTQTDMLRGTYGFQSSFGGTVVYDLGVPGRERIGVFARKRGRLAVHNLTNSPLGAGWGVAGLQRVHFTGGSYALVTDGSGNASIFSTSGFLTKVAGVGFQTGVWQWAGDGHSATSINLPAMEGLAADTKGNFYAANRSFFRIIKVDPAGIATSIAGGYLGISGFAGDGGPATLARLSENLNGIVFDKDGNLFICDTNNNRIRKIDTAGRISTIAGTGTWGYTGDGGLALHANIYAMDVAVSSEGEVYFAGGWCVRKIDRAGVITTIAGLESGGLPEDGVPAINARLTGGAWTLAFGPNGDLYVAGSDRIRRIDKNGLIWTIAGAGAEDTSADPLDLDARYGDGKPATQAVLSSVQDIAVDPLGNIYISERGHKRVRRVNPEGVISTVAGGGTQAADWMAAREADITPTWLAIEPSGTLLINTTYKVYRYVPSDPTSETWIAAGVLGDFTQLVLHVDHTFTRQYPNGDQINFDVDGYAVSRADRNGNTTAYAWAAGPTTEKLLTQITDPVGKITTLTYDGGKLSTITDPAGRVTHCSIDAAGNLVSIVNPDSTARQFVYDSSHQLTRQTDAGGQVTNYAFDASGSVTAVAYADSSQRTYHAALGGAIINAAGVALGTVENPAILPPSSQYVPVVTDATGRAMHYQVNNFGTRVRFTDDLGRTTSVERDGNDSATSVTLPSGRTLNYEYNARGQVNRVTDPVAQTSTTIAYGTDFNLPVAITDAVNAVWQFEYDVHGNLIRMTDPNGGETLTSFDARGLPVSITDPLGRTITLSRDADGNILAVRDALNQQTSYAYDGYGNIALITDADGHATSWAFNVMNLPTRRTEPNGAVVDMTWAAALGSQVAGNDSPLAVLTTLTDPRGKSYHFGYDARYRRISRQDPSGALWRLAFDSEGRLLSSIDANGQTMAYTYDAGGRRVSRTSGGNLRTYEYTADGKVTRIAEGTSQIVYTYDALDQLASVTTTVPDLGLVHTASYGRDALGRVSTLQDSTGGSCTYTRDPADNLTSIGLGGASITLGYNAAGQMTSMGLPNGCSNQWAYDGAGRVQQVRYRAGATALEVVTYGYDASGNVTSRTDADGSHTFTHDAAGQLISATHPNPGVNPNESYAFDLSGNRTASHRSTAYAVDDANRLVADQQYTYLYDANGNLIQRTQISNGAVAQYTYNSDNRLVNVGLPDGQQIQYRYDLLGRRVARTLGGAQALYVYDGQQLLAELDGGGSVSARYVYGRWTDRPMLMIRGSDLYGYHADLTGSVGMITGPTGSIANRYTYDSFGRMVAQSESVANAFTFAGREYDAMAGLYYNRARFYDPGIGRFISPDPSGLRESEPNLYRYVLNQPLIATDPLGLIYLTVGGQTSAEGAMGVGGGIYGGGGFILGTSHQRGCGGLIGYSNTAEAFLVGEGADVGYGLNVNFSPFGQVEDFTGDSVGIQVGGGLLGKIGLNISVPMVNTENGQPTHMNFWGTSIGFTIGAEAGEHLTGGIFHSHTEYVK